MTNTVPKTAAAFLHSMLQAPCLSTSMQSWVKFRVALQELDESEGQIVACLQDSRDMLMNMQCREQVHKVMARASEDIRFNQMLADACFNDREQFCSTTQQVSFGFLLQLLHLFTCQAAHLLLLCLQSCTFDKVLLVCDLACTCQVHVVH